MLNRNILVLVMLILPSVVYAADVGRWTCSQGDLGPGFWIAESDGGNAQVYALKSDCGSGRDERGLCFLSAGNFIDTAHIVHNGLPNEDESIVWGTNTFSIFYPGGIGGNQSNAYFLSQPNVSYQCEYELIQSQFSSTGPDCGCNGADYGTSACFGHGPDRCK